MYNYYFWGSLFAIFMLTNSEIAVGDMNLEQQSPFTITTYPSTLIEENEELKKRNVYRPMATIFITPTTYNSTKTTITTVELKRKMQIKSITIFGERRMVHQL
ncbi:hypothetical protein V7147_09155 [Bacillus sp. JJ1521]